MHHSSHDLSFNLCLLVVWNYILISLSPHSGWESLIYLLA